MWLLKKNFKGNIIVEKIKTQFWHQFFKSHASFNVQFLFINQTNFVSNFSQIMIYAPSFDEIFHVALHVFTWKLPKRKIRITEKSSQQIIICEKLWEKGKEFDLKVLFQSILQGSFVYLWASIKTRFQSERFQSCSVQISRNSLELTCFMLEPAWRRFHKLFCIFDNLGNWQKF